MLSKSMELKEVSCLAKQFLTNTEIDLIKEQWHDFKFEMSEMKTKYATLKKQFLENKLKFRKTSTGVDFRPYSKCTPRKQ